MRFVCGTRNVGTPVPLVAAINDENVVWKHVIPVSNPLQAHMDTNSKAMSLGYGHLIVAYRSSFPLNQDLPVLTQKPEIDSGISPSKEYLLPSPMAPSFQNILFIIQRGLLFTFIRYPPASCISKSVMICRGLHSLWIDRIAIGKVIQPHHFIALFQ
jgi:hypothetical protein